MFDCCNIQLSKNIVTKSTYVHYLFQEAVRENAKAIRFVVLKWNPAMKFYKQFGTTNLTEKEEWQFTTLKYEDVIKAANLFK